MEGTIECQTNKYTYQNQYHDKDMCQVAGQQKLRSGAVGFECGKNCHADGIMICDIVCDSKGRCSE